MLEFEDVGFGGKRGRVLVDPLEAARVTEYETESGWVTCIVLRSGAVCEVAGRKADEVLAARVPTPAPKCSCEQRYAGPASMPIGSSAESSDPLRAVQALDDLLAQGHCWPEGAEALRRVVRAAIR